MHSGSLSISEVENIEHALSILNNSSARYDSGKLIIECSKKPFANLLNDILSINKIYSDISIEIGKDSAIYALGNRKVNYSVSCRGITKCFDNIEHFKKYLSILFDKGDTRVWASL